MSVTIIPSAEDYYDQVIQNGGFELNGGGDPGLDHWNKRGCQMSAEQWDVHQGETLHCWLKVQPTKAKTVLYSDF